ncbi:MAG: UPF0182 family protein [Xenococcaceae cyanobacterium]
MSRRFTETVFRVVVLLLGLWLAFELAAHIIAEILWFQDVGYLPTFIKRLQSQLGLWVVASSTSVLFLLGNLFLAVRLKWRKAPAAKIRDTESARVLPNPQSPVLRLPLLLPIVLGFSLLVGLMLLHYSQIALSVWQPDYSLPNMTPPLPSPFKIHTAPQILPQISEQIWKLGGIVGVVILLLVNPEFWLYAIACILSLVFGLVLSGNWTRVLQYFNPTAFNKFDPLFGNDISFYIFKLPVWQLLDFWLGGLFLYGLIAVSLTYLLSADSLSQGKFPGFSRPQLRHVYGLGGLMMLAVALHHWLERYELLYSQRGVTYGASYTDVNIQLPVETVLGIVAGAIALWLLLKAITGSGKRSDDRRIARTKITKIPFSPLPFYLYLIIFIAGICLSETVQSLGVQPNELARERPYLERSIAFTRAAFDLDNIEVKTFDPEGQLTAADIQKNHLTIENIRLWDTRPVLQTNRQLQQIRLYYKFPDADIDRYTMKVEKKVREGEWEDLPIPTTERQQVIIAPRELDYSAVPDRAKTWVNEHLVYTHGYGFTLSPVNLVDEGGLPYYFVKDIGTGTEEGGLRTSSELIQYSIPIGKPRIYYGELTNAYVMTSTKVPEFDFPSGEENVYNTYNGTGGISIGSSWRRLLFAKYLKDWQMLFTRNFTDETRLLFRRDINSRIRAIAPFLHYDRDPYLVVADAGKEEGAKNYLHWIVDAYTTSDSYPYSDPGDNKFNYIRNSVKIVIDAYNGDVDFYIADPNDPIIQTWEKIFPELFKPLDAMPATLRSHIRYPEDLFSTQSERLLTYHMTDPQVFYNREDQWEIPREIYGSQLQPVAPYYLIMKLPTATSEEFILLNPYTPTSRPNLIAWLAGRSDGKQYGKLLLYQFPKQKLVYGPDQIEALINQDPVISQQISLWNREGSRAIQGNLLVIPIEESLLYVEPLYIEAEQNSLPILARVIVVYENRIIMAETLDQALQAIFQPEQQPTPAIIRPLNEV